MTGSFANPPPGSPSELFSETSTERYSAGGGPAPRRPASRNGKIYTGNIGEQTGVPLLVYFPVFAVKELMSTRFHRGMARNSVCLQERSHILIRPQSPPDQISGQSGGLTQATPFSFFVRHAVKLFPSGKSEIRATRSSLLQNTTIRTTRNTANLFSGNSEKERKISSLFLFHHTPVIVYSAFRVKSTEYCGFSCFSG